MQHASEDDHLRQVAPSTPWYLQLDPPQRLSNPLLERQKLPPLPHYPPPLLKPILEHISTDLGLDNLTLFDLRNIDPPPALGANLLMIIGTARSDKHLHVSADRFCRWLKTNHRLSPYADGLLGRGELKLKLKRKARRARLLSNVGSSETESRDDGLRTSWICINVGTIQDGRENTEDYSDQEAYVGFGGETEGAKVVVQMLTQEKREELDLEDLWRKMLIRHERKESRIEKGQDESQMGQGTGESSLVEKGPVPDSLFLTSPRWLKNPVISDASQPQKSQRRFISSKSPSEIIQIDQQQSQVAQVISRIHTAQGNSVPNIKVLQRHIKFLTALPRYYALKALGKDSFDTKSTTFLDSFYGIYPKSPRSEHWECRLALMCFATAIGHPGYTKARLFEVFEETTSRVVLQQRTFEMLFSTFLTSNPEKAGRISRLTLTCDSLQDALIVLDAMHSRGYDIGTPDRREELRKATNKTFRWKRMIRTGDPERLKMLLDRLHMKLHDSPGYPLVLRMLLESLDELPEYQGEPHYQDQHPKFGADSTQNHSHDDVKVA
ncbi:ATPase synthesis protein 25 mitochondrial [Lecanora helva]